MKLRDATVHDSVRRLIAERPKFHSARDFNPQWDPSLFEMGVDSSVLRLISEIVTPSCSTLETGSGLSTVVFAIVGCEHVCISPMKPEHERIHTYCQQRGISTSRIRFVALPSEVYLPTMVRGGRMLDFALIDGAHDFPAALIDYCYINQHLRVGGMLIVDDLDIASVGLLHKFLATEPAYEVVDFNADRRTGIYRKIAKTSYPDGWRSQPFNRRYPDLSYLPFRTRLRKKIARVPLVAKARRFLMQF